jgi:uncharacterized phage protein (TIGR01671 family)
MREIKFRAYHKEKRKMYDVEVIDFPNGGVTLHLPGEGWFGCAIDEVEMMEYTGLKDMNSKEIYEGDRIRYKEINWAYDEIDAPNESKWDYFTDVVVFEKGEFKASESGVGWEGECLIDLEDSEVIGNIYGNDDLIENLNRTKE